MELRVQSGSTFSYSDVEIAEGELVQSKRLSSDSGREQLENGDVEIALYGSFMGYDTLDDYLDGLTGGFSHLRAQLKDERFNITIEGSIYEGDLSYDEVDDKWIVLLLGDAEEEARERLRRIGDLEQEMRDHVVANGDSELDPHPLTRVWTAGAPTSEGDDPLWMGTVRHRVDDSGNPSRDNAIDQEWGGYQCVGEHRTYRPGILLDQLLPKDVEPHPDHTSAHATTPRTGSVPPIPQETETYVAEDGTETTIDLPRVSVFSVSDWSEPERVRRVDGDTVYRGIPSWTLEEVLDYYLQKAGRRLIATYEPFPSDTIQLVFADDSTDLNASAALGTVGTEGLATGDPREQNFYNADMERPRLPDLAVQHGPVFEKSILPSGFGRCEHLDIAQREQNHADADESAVNPDGSTEYYSPIVGEEEIFYIKAWRRSPKEGMSFGHGKPADTYTAHPPPPRAKYAAKRWGAGRDTRVVEENESSVQLPTRPAQILQVCDKGGMHQKGRIGEIRDLAGDQDSKDYRYFADTIFDPWRDPTLSPDQTKGVANLLDHPSPRHWNIQRGWEREEIETGDVHRYGYHSDSEQFQSGTKAFRWDYLNFKKRGLDHGSRIVLDIEGGDDEVFNTSKTTTAEDIAQAAANEWGSKATRSGNTVTVQDPGFQSINHKPLPWTGGTRPKQATWTKELKDVDGDGEDEAVYTFHPVENIPSNWEVALEYGWPIIPYESEGVYEVAVGGERPDTATISEANCLFWADFRKPGTTEQSYERRAPAKVRDDQGFSDIKEAVQWLNTEGLAKANDGIGLHGLTSPTWAYTTWVRREASQSDRIEVEVEADVSGLDFEVGDPNRGIEWRGYKWLVQKVEQQADRPIATLTLERYSPVSLSVNDLHTQGDTPTLAPPRNVQLQKTLTHALVDKNNNLLEQSTLEDSSVNGPVPTCGSDVLELTWQHPQHEDQARVWYYEVQSIPLNWPSKSTAEFPMWRVYVTTGTVMYDKTPNTLPEYKSTFRVRAVGWPDENGNVETSDFAYPQKQNARVLRTKDIDGSGCVINA